MIRHLFALVVLGLGFICAASAQTPVVQRDTQAVTALAQVLAASGGFTPIQSVHDYRATGTITYNWAGEQVQGSATLRGRGTKQFRLDANLPTGVRTWAVSYEGGIVKEADGTTVSIPSHNSINLGSLTFPLAQLVRAAQDSSFSLAYVGLVTVGGRQAHQVRVRDTFGAQGGKADPLSKLSTRDFFIDAQSLQLVSIRDAIHPLREPTQDIPHEMFFADYRVINGILIPFSISEKVAGQTTWTIQLTQFNFNPGLQDTDFQP